MGGTPVGRASCVRSVLAGRWNRSFPCVRDTLPEMALHTHAAVKTPTDAGDDEMLAEAVADVAREASTDATDELVTRSHFDTVFTQLESSPGHGRLEISLQRSRVVVRDSGTSDAS